MADRFCEFCDSKGIIHKKGCPMNNKQEENTENKEGGEVRKFKLKPAYNLPESPSMADLFAFCLANEGGIEVSLETYQKIPDTIKPLFK